VWRDLDWLSREHKVGLAVDSHDDLQRALLAVFRSQIQAGKRYDLGAVGRRRANAVFSDAREVDRHEGIVWADDLSELVRSEGNPLDHARALLGAFESEVSERIERLR
jgi:hypothetical protein